MRKHVRRTVNAHGTLRVDINRFFADAWGIGLLGMCCVCADHSVNHSFY